MGKLDAALAWAGRGFRVFPLQVNSKHPTEMAWTVQATTDPETIRRWWTDPLVGVERDNNIGFLTTGWIVSDVDAKAGKAGLETFADLGMDFDTLTTRTASGGYHLIYQGLGHPIGQSPIGRDIDIRSHNGFVVAPGSTINGVAYTVELDQPVAAFPEHLRERLKRPRQREDVIAPDIDLDTPELLEIVTHYLLRDAPAAVQGANGDDTTYRVIARMRDYGVSEGAAVDLFLDAYNPRCSPPWVADEARAKVENVYRYATGPIGAKAPAAEFGGVQTVEASPHTAGAVAAPHLNGNVYRFGNMLDETDIEARRWIMGHILLAGVVTTLIAAPGAGKSSFTLALAAHLAVGREFMGYRVHRTGRVIVVNPEDDLQEASRRLNAICAAYGIDREQVRTQLALVGHDEHNLRLTNSRPPTINAEHVQHLMQTARDNDVVAIVVDPLAEHHSANENDNGEMNYVMAVMRHIARQADCAVVAVHHTGKPPSADSKGFAGNQNAGRGASSVPGSARVVLTLFPASEADCVGIGVLPENRDEYVRLDDGKTSYSARDRASRWLRWRSVTIANNDSVGVLVPHDATKAFDQMSADVARALVTKLLHEGDASMSIEDAISALMGADPLAAKEDRQVVRTRITRVLSSPIMVGETRVACVQETEGSKKSLRIVIG